MNGSIFPTKTQTDIDYDQVVEWAETAGFENLKRRHANADAIKAQALSTLTILLTGIGGSLVFATKALEGDRTPIVWGGVALCIYLMILCGLLVHNILQIKDYPSVYHAPKALAERGVSLTAQREKMIDYLEQAIQTAVTLNSQMAAQVNGIRWAAIASPIVFAIGASVMH